MKFCKDLSGGDQGDILFKTTTTTFWSGNEFASLATVTKRGRVLVKGPLTDTWPRTEPHRASVREETETLLDFNHQNHYKSGMAQNQNPEHRTDNPVKREEPDSASATTVKQ